MKLEGAFVNFSRHKEVSRVRFQAEAACIMSKLEQGPQMSVQGVAPPTHKAHRALLTTLSDQPNIVEDFFNAELTHDGKLKARGEFVR